MNTHEHPRTQQPSHQTVHTTAAKHRLSPPKQPCALTEALNLTRTIIGTVGLLICWQFAAESVKHGFQNHVHLCST